MYRNGFAYAELDIYMKQSVKNTRDWEREGECRARVSATISNYMCYQVYLVEIGISMSHLSMCCSELNTNCAEHFFNDFH